MVFRWGHFDLRTFAFRSKMRECEVAKAKVRECDGEGAKVRRCDGEARSCDGESAKVRRRSSDTTIALSPSQLRTLRRNFALSPSPLLFVELSIV